MPNRISPDSVLLRRNSDKSLESCAQLFESRRLHACRMDNALALECRANFLTPGMVAERRHPGLRRGPGWPV